MFFAWLVNIVLLYHADKSYFSKHFNISSKTCNILYYTLNYPWYIWTYSKVLKPSKTDIFNIQLVHNYTTYIFCISIIYKNNSFSVSKISPGCIGLTTPTLHWRTHWSLQWWYDPANTYNIRLRYGTLHSMTHRLPACSHITLPVSMSS
jgi:hypothetical protein